ncbi:MAG: TIGR04283 family arsenosugar biosynthesis glycosyltransferase [Betaproteobacteria bacterium]|nr:TIGR04283 family arsenosugar biosynthesis glycosyltransferase [Betaproteobacteria bacterium]
MRREVKPASLSIVVPTLNEAPGIVSFLQPLQRLRERGVELILADGGSRDGTVAAATPLVDRVISARRGPASQMNAGAAVCAGDVLLFLHADCTLPEHADHSILNGLASSRRRWGRFDVRLSGAAIMLRVVERAMNLRSRLTGICTGDQALFVERTVFEQSGGFPEIELMEDVAFSGQLRKSGPPLCLSVTLVASSRRWEKNGIWRTILLMWRLRLAYFLGSEPRRLAERYHGREK